LTNIGRRDGRDGGWLEFRGIAPTDHRHLIGTQRRPDAKWGVVGEEPDGTRCGALAEVGARRRIVEIAVDVNDVEILGLPGVESGDGADHDTAVATDEQRNLARLLEDRRDAIANTFPGDARTRPTADGWNGMVREVTGDGDVTIVGDFAAGGLEARSESGVAISLRVVLVAGIKRTAA